MPPGLTSSEAENVFPVGTCSCITHMYHIHSYIHDQPYRSTPTDTQSTHTNTDSTSSLILHPSLAEQGGGPPVANMCVWAYAYTYIYIHTHIHHYQSCPDLQMLTPSSCWRHGHTPPPTHSLTLFAGIRSPIHSHTHWVRSPSPRKTLRPGVWWEDRADSADQAQGMARQPYWPETCSHPTRPLLSPYASSFPCSFLPKPPRSLPLPAFSSPPKQPKVRLVQSQSALRESHTPRLWPTQSVRCPRDPGTRSPWLTMMGAIPSPLGDHSLW